MNNDSISRSALKKAVEELKRPKAYSEADVRQNVVIDCVLHIINNATTVEAVSDEHIKEAFETGYKMSEINLNKRTKGDRTERALSIIDRLRTDGHINNKEQGILRRTILLPEPPSDVK